ncbi:hypothetical protein [Comamonas sp.]|uniref:hypothetical protein n=1 Tax=Comamonas sp. TaxID=34028 RepID=UPI003A8E0D0F
MPLYTIKHLKAPWPAAAVVGDVIEFEVLPGWAAGKCELGGTQATVFADQEVSGDGSGAALAPVDSDAAKIAAALAAADEQARRELNSRVLAAEQALAVAKSDLEVSLAREVALQANLTDAQKLNEAAAGELEKVRGQVADLQAQLTAAKAETKAAKK